MKKYSILLLFFLISSIPLFAQNSTPNWSTYYEDDQIEIQISSQACHLASRGTHQQVLYLSFRNKTQSTIELNYKRKVWYDGQCYGCDPGAEKEVSIQLQPLAQEQGSCTAGPKDKRFQIFQWSIEGGSDAQLTNFELADIQVQIL
jgi:hypothetical protein